MTPFALLVPPCKRNLIYHSPQRLGISAKYGGFGNIQRFGGCNFSNYPNYASAHSVQVIGTLTDIGHQTDAGDRNHYHQRVKRSHFDGSLLKSQLRRVSCRNHHAWRQQLPLKSQLREWQVESPTRARIFSKPRLRPSPVPGITILGAYCVAPEMGANYATILITRSLGCKPETQARQPLT